MHETHTMTNDKYFYFTLGGCPNSAGPEFLSSQVQRGSVCVWDGTLTMSNGKRDWNSRNAAMHVTSHCPFTSAGAIVLNEND